MPRVTDTRQRMIRTASRLLRRQGYAATGWRQVVADSETPWGSQAHHFPGGKEQLAVEALTASGAAYERLLTRAFTAHPADTITAWGALAGAELEASGWADGCPIATVTLETAHTSQALAGVCGAALTSWREIIAESLVRHGLAPADAVPLATLILAAIEGALLLARATRDVTPLHDVAQQLSDVVRNRIG